MSDTPEHQPSDPSPAIDETMGAIAPVPPLDGDRRGDRGKFPELPAVSPANDPDRLVIPAHVRRSPRFARMIGTGVGAGIVLAAVLAIVLPNSTGSGRFMVFVVLALGIGLMGALIAGAIATRLDGNPAPAAPAAPAAPTELTDTTAAPHASEETR